MVVDLVSGLTGAAEEVLVVWDCGTQRWSAPGPGSGSGTELELVFVTGVESAPELRSCLTLAVLVWSQALVVSAVLAVPSVSAVESWVPPAAPFVVAHVSVVVV